MSVDFDARTGSAVLDRVTFDALLAVTAGADPPATGIDRARAAGLVEGVTVHHAVRAAIRAAADPVAVARLEMRNERSAFVTAECWVSTDAACYLVGPDGGPLRLLGTPPAAFPISIARLVGLSPRPRLPFVPWRMPVEMVDDTQHEDDDRRREAVGRIVETVDDAGARAFTEVLVDGPWWYWTLTVRWAGASGREDERTLHIVDSQAGMAMLLLSDGRIAAEPTNPTDVFRLLTAILPRDDELATA